MARAALPLSLAFAAALPLAAAPFLAAACAETPRGPLAGASDAWDHTPEPAASTQTPSPIWDEYAALQQWPRANPAPFTSHGHQPEQQVDVRVNPAAASSYAALVTDTVFPDGSILAELSHAGSGHGYVMRKSAGKWSYLELDARGALLASGALSLCAACHAQAPADQVFGLARDP